MNTTQPLPGMLRRSLPTLTWGAEYSRRTLLANVLSHPVISGFITASDIRIAARQAEGCAV
jgi:hypothetical protein